MWPSLETAALISGVANIVFISSAALGVVATVFIVWMGNVKEAHWDTLRDASNQRIAETNARAEEAKAEAARAQLELEKFKEPRRLNIEQRKRLVAELKQFAGTRIDILVFVPGSSPDTFLFGNNLFVEFMNAGWKIKYWNVAAAQDHFTGVEISIPADLAAGSVFPIAEKVVEILKSEGIAANMSRAIVGTAPPGVLLGPDWDEKDVALIRMQVGTKP